MEKLRREAFVKIYDPELAKLDQKVNEKRSSRVVEGVES